MMNPIKPIPCEILEVKKETELEWTFKVKTDVVPNHGQFMQLSIPKVGEAPISISAFGDGWMDFTIRAVGKVTDSIFNKKTGDTLFLRGPYGNGWPFNEQFKGKHLVFITGGTGLAPVRSMLNKCYNEDVAKSVTLIGPPPMMKFTAQEAMKCGVPEEKIWVSYERKMSCAIGKCGHCRIDEVYVCLDGPVFNYTVAKDLVD